MSNKVCTSITLEQTIRHGLQYNSRFIPTRLFQIIVLNVNRYTEFNIMSKSYIVMQYRVRNRINIMYNLENIGSIWTMNIIYESYRLCVCFCLIYLVYPISTFFYNPLAFFIDRRIPHTNEVSFSSFSPFIFSSNTHLSHEDRGIIRQNPIVVLFSVASLLFHAGSIRPMRFFVLFFSMRNNNKVYWRRNSTKLLFFFCIT